MKLKIGTKLGIAFATLLCLMIVSSGLAYLKSREIQAIGKSVAVRNSTQKALFELQRELNQTQSKGRQATLAGTEQDRRDAARKMFIGTWDVDIKKDVAELDTLAPKWSLQENRDRWEHAKEVLPKLRAAQEAAMDVAVSNNPKSVVKGGNDFADKATSVNEPLKVALGDMSDSFAALATQSNEQLAAANSTMNWTMLISILMGLGVGAWRSHLHGPQHFRSDDCAVEQSGSNCRRRPDRRRNSRYKHERRARGLGHGYE